MLIHHGDIHHIFPRNFLKKKGLSRGKYIQAVFDQCDSGKPRYGAITDMALLKENLGLNCLPHDIEEYAYENYEEFLLGRRKLMIKKIKTYYQSL